MNRILSLAVVIAALSFFSSDINAQNQNGYYFGVGLGQSGINSPGAYNVRGSFQNVGGFRLGTGIRNAGGVNQGRRLRGGVGFGGTVFPTRPAERELPRPPYFAEFPPVYYGDVVPRNYGASPYAAPAGIMPVEGLGGTYNGQPQQIVNPYVPQEGAPTEESVPPEPADNDKSNASDSKDATSKKAPWDKDA